MRIWCSSLLAVYMIATMSMPSSVPAAPPQPTPTNANTSFRNDIQPILKAKCVGCHGPEARKAELDLSTSAGVLKGSESGDVVVAGKLDESLLFDMIASGLMPPEEESVRLTQAEIDTIGRWIKQGAPLGKSAATAETRLTQHDVIPIMLRRCTMCHGPTLQEAQLNLRTTAGMIKGGKSGPAIVPGKPEESLILKKIHSAAMPPKESVGQAGIEPMSANELDVLTAWIAAGAPNVPTTPDVATAEPDPLVTDSDRQFWSFQPPGNVRIPMPANTRQVRNPVDAFLLTELETKGLTYSPEADRRTLIRRLSFDLTGLPPTPDEIDVFVSDRDPSAYEKLADRLLASTAHAEHWAQWWLDLAGYADSEGKRHADMIRNDAYRYRDYVIRSMAEDKPIKDFLVEQIAGDELIDHEHLDSLTDRQFDYLVATGFLRMAPDGTSANPVNRVSDRIEVIADEIDILCRGVMGLTIKCARCHSHKYDPIPQRDFYRLAAVFKGAYDEHDWLTPQPFRNQWKQASIRFLPYMKDPERRAWEGENRLIDNQIESLRNALARRTDELSKKLREERLAELPKELHGDLLRMLETPAGKRNAVLTYLAEKFETGLRFDRKTLEKVDSDYRKFASSQDKKVKALEAKRPQPPRIRALWDRGHPSPTYILRRGDPLQPSRLVGPGVPSVLTNGATPFEVTPPWPGARQTGRRLAFAKWLTHPAHPLTARVFVNRVWERFFGVGIVKTLDNFGKTGAAPSNQQLLDWLARRFIAGGWSVKGLQRLLVTSTAYRQVSSVTEKQQHADPENLLVSRMPIKRMTAEMVRDSILSIAGRLNRRPFGKPDQVKVRDDGLVTAVATNESWRRSIYIRHRRKEMPTILETFDLPQMNPNCIDRPASSVVSQPLHLFNNGQIYALAAHFADRIEGEVGNDVDQQIDRGFLIAFGRSPTDQERQDATEALAQLTRYWAAEADAIPEEKTPRQQALHDFCHTLVNSAAFLYVD